MKVLIMIENYINLLRKILVNDALSLSYLSQTLGITYTGNMTVVMVFCDHCRYKFLVESILMNQFVDIHANLMMKSQMHA